MANLLFDFIGITLPVNGFSFDYLRFSLFFFAKAELIQEERWKNILLYFNGIYVIFKL